MLCPKCAHDVSGVLSTRHTIKGTIERRRFCASCGVRFTTIETVALDVQMTMPGERREHPMTGTGKSSKKWRKRPKPTGVIGNPRKEGGDLDRRLAAKAARAPITPRYNPTTASPAAAFLAPAKSRSKKPTPAFGAPKV